MMTLGNGDVVYRSVKESVRLLAVNGFTVSSSRVHSAIPSASFTWLEGPVACISGSTSIRGVLWCPVMTMGATQGNTTLRGVGKSSLVSVPRTSGSEMLGADSARDFRELRTPRPHITTEVISCSNEISTYRSSDGADRVSCWVH